MTTTEQSLPITEMLEKIPGIGDYVCIALINELELSLIEKAKEEERERIVGIIDDMISGKGDRSIFDAISFSFGIDVLKEIKERITSDNQ